MIKGLAAIKEMADNSNEYLRIENGKTKTIRIMTPASEIVGIYEHTEQFGGQWKTVSCLGKSECPLCQADRKASFKAYMAVIDRDDDKVKVLKLSKTVTKQLVALVEEYGDISARDFKVLRSGEKLATTYQFFPKDPKVEEFSKYNDIDLETIINPMTREQILALMNSGSVAVDTKEPREGYPF